MIPWIELLFYMAVLFAPDDAVQLAFDREGELYVFEKNDSRIWHSVEYPGEEWDVREDALVKTIDGEEFRYDLIPFDPQGFGDDGVYRIDDGFFCEKRDSGFTFTMELPGNRPQKSLIQWRLAEEKSLVPDEKGWLYRKRIENEYGVFHIGTKESGFYETNNALMVFTDEIESDGGRIADGYGIFYDYIPKEEGDDGKPVNLTDINIDFDEELLFVVYSNGESQSIPFYRNMN